MIDLHLSTPKKRQYGNGSAVVPGGTNTGWAIARFGSGLRKEIEWEKQGGVDSEGHVIIRDEYWRLAPEWRSL